jgi:type I restriction enzyme S subunit
LRVPESWKQVRLGELCELLTGYAFKSDSYVPKSVNQIIRLGNVKNNAILLDQKPAFISDEVAKESVEYLIRENDLLITMTGTKAKRDYLFTSVVRVSHLSGHKLFLNQRVGALRFCCLELTELANVFLKGDILLDQLFAQSVGTANQGNIGVASIRNLPFPLPPLAEQKRIIAKVNQLMSLCDELEAKLRQAEADDEKLMNAAVKHVLDSVRDVSKTAEEIFA